MQPPLTAIQATIYDVAARAGCSPRTISRYFNAPHKLADRTRDRIAAVVDELDFRPNAFANRVSRQNLNMMGALVCADTPRHFYHAYRDMVSVASLELARRDRDLLLLSVDSDNEARVIHESFRQRKVDGLLIMGQPSTRLAAELARCSFPKIALGDAVVPDMPGLRRVSVDARAAYSQMTAALLARGYRRPVFVQTAEPRLRLAQHLAGARDAVAACPGATLRVLDAHATLVGAADCLDACLRLDPPPDLVLAQGDILAVCFLQAARARGLAVPADLGVAGFFGLELLDYLAPRLTTVRIPYQRLAEAAVRLLVEAPAATADLLLPAQVELGQSTR